MKVIDYGNFLEALKALPESSTKKDILRLLRMIPILDQEDLPLVKDLRVQIKKMNIEIADREKCSIEQHSEIHQYQDEIRELREKITGITKERNEAEAALVSWFVPDGMEE